MIDEKKEHLRPYEGDLFHAICQGQAFDPEQAALTLSSRLITEREINDSLSLRLRSMATQIRMPNLK